MRPKRRYEPSIRPEGWSHLKPLVERRVRLGLSQGELSAATGIAVADICRAERGRIARVTEAYLARYREGLDKLEHAL